MFFKEIILRNKSVFIVGDMNDDLVYENSHLGTLFKTYRLHQLIKKATHITQNSSSLIDVIATNNADMIKYSDVVPCPTADHELITLTNNVRKARTKPVYKTYRSLKNYTSENFCNILLEKTPILNSIIVTDDVDVRLVLLLKC